MRTKKNKDLGRKRRKIYIFPVFALDFLSLSAIDKLFWNFRIASHGNVTTNGWIKKSSIYSLYYSHTHKDPELIDS